MCVTVLILSLFSEKHIEVSIGSGKVVARRVNAVFEPLIRLPGLKESTKMSLTDSELLTGIMDEARRQVGVVYEQDSQ